MTYSPRQNQRGALERLAALPPGEWAEARVSVLESQLAAATQRAEAAEAKLAEVPWEDLGATIVCAQHWTPKGPDGLNFREDHAAFARLDAWLEANGPELPSTTIEPKDELE